MESLFALDNGMYWNDEEASSGFETGISMP
jgi:hypothetical protein